MIRSPTAMRFSAAGSRHNWPSAGLVMAAASGGRVGSLNAPWHGSINFAALTCAMNVAPVSAKRSSCSLPSESSDEVGYPHREAVWMVQLTIDKLKAERRWLKLVRRHARRCATAQFAVKEKT
jgi:hypothetical protein